MIEPSLLCQGSLVKDNIGIQVKILFRIVCVRLDIRLELFVVDLVGVVGIKSKEYGINRDEVFDSEWLPRLASTMLLICDVDYISFECSSEHPRLSRTVHLVKAQRRNDIKEVSHNVQISKQT